MSEEINEYSHQQARMKCFLFHPGYVEGDDCVMFCHVESGKNNE